MNARFESKIPAIMEYAMTLAEPNVVQQVFAQHIRRALYPFRPAGGMVLSLDDDLVYQEERMHVEIGRGMIIFTVDLPPSYQMLDTPFTYGTRIGEQAAAHIRAWQNAEVPDNIILADN